MVKALSNEITPTIIRQFIAVRDSGICNMFDRDCVQQVALSKNFVDLVMWIQDHKRAYGQLLEAVNEYLASDVEDDDEDWSLADDEDFEFDEDETLEIAGYEDWEIEDDDEDADDWMNRI